MHFLKNKKVMLLFDGIDNVKVDFELPSELSVQVDMIGLTKRDVQRMKMLKPIIEKHTKNLVDNFYDTIMKEPSLMEIISTHSSVERLGKTLYNHIIEIFSGRVNCDYVSQRKQIAHVHVRIGLSTKWYVNAFQHLLNQIIKILHEEIADNEELYDAVNALAKMFSLEQQLVLDSYEKKEESIREEQRMEKEQFQETMKTTAYELSAIAQETSMSIQDLVSQFDSIKTLTDEGNQVIGIVESLSEDGKVRMGQEAESANRSKEQISSLQEEIGGMIELSHKIDNVVEVVGSIANQINLLALNASIESARAGEHGKGFAVVANEIRNLSTKTKQSTEDISSLVKAISEQVKHVEQSVKQFNRNIVQNQKLTEETSEFFEQIVRSVKESKEKSGDIFEEIKNSGTILTQINLATTEISRTADTLNS